MTKMRVIGWRVYLSDGSVLSCVDGSWKDLPADDMQVVVVFYAETYSIWDTEAKRWRLENYREVLRGADYYWLEGVEPKCGAAAVAQAKSVTGTVKLGKLLADEEFMKIYNAAQRDRVW